ncbi:uncharacterized protein PHA67_018209 [Liasis olivaceus]
MILLALFFFAAVSLQLLLSESIQKDVPHLPAPTLSWSPFHRFFIRGELIKLKCSIPKGQSGGRICFLHTNENGQWTECKEGNGSTMAFSTLRLPPNVSFSCCYEGKNAEGKASKSKRSEQVEISVIDSPPSPSLSPVPSEPLYLVGKKVTLWCSAPTVTLQGWRRYQFSQSAEDQSSAKSLDLHEDPSLVLTASREKEGRYACRYVERKYGRSISSEWSHPVPILVRDPLPPPVLKVDPPSGAVGESKPLSIFCLSNESNNTKRFHFSRDGVEITSSNKGPLRSSREPVDVTLNMSLSFLYANHNQSGGFACRYEENINGRWIMSPWSQMLNIRAPFASSLGYAALVLLVPFLGVPLTLYWNRRKNASGCQQKSERKEKNEEAKLNDLGSERLEREELQVTTSSILPFVGRTVYEGFSEPGNPQHAIYVFASGPSAGIPLGPLTTVEGDGALYSELQQNNTLETCLKAPFGRPAFPSAGMEEEL